MKTQADKMRQDAATDKASALEQLSAQHSRALDVLRDEHAAALEALRADMTRKMESAAQAAKARQSASEQELRNIFAEERSNLERTLMSDHKSEIQRLNQTHLSETKQLNNEFFEAKQAMENAHHELEGRFKDLEARFLSRESRPEDVERIRFLEAQMVKKDAEIKSVREEMRYFKLELLNREENFNSKFSRGPNQGQMNVGVMQVIKPKGKGGRNGRGKGGKGGRRDSNSIQAGLPPLGVGGPGRPSSDSRRQKPHQREPRGPPRAANMGPPGAPQRRGNGRRPQ